MGNKAVAMEPFVYVEVWLNGVGGCEYVTNGWGCLSCVALRWQDGVRVGQAFIDGVRVGLYGF